MFWPTPLSDEAVNLMLQVGLGLSYLHDRNIVHRDLKSQNLLVPRLNSRVQYECVNLVDFGISKLNNLDVDALPVLNTQKDPQNDGYHNFSDACSLCEPGKDKILLKDFLSKIRLFRALYTSPARSLRGQAPDISDASGALANAFAAAGFKKLESIHICTSDYQRTDFNLEEIRFAPDLQTSGLRAHGRSGNRKLLLQSHKLQRSVDLLSQDTISIPELQLKLLDLKESASLENVDMSSGRVHDIFYRELAKAESKRQKMDLERKRIPTRDWSADELRAVLELTQEAVRVDVEPDFWDYVSENLLKQYGFDRASNSCQQRWDTLLKSFNAIREHESKIQSGTSSCVTYWEMDEDERSKNKLLQTFDLEWYEMLERILTAKSFDEKTSSIHLKADLPSSDLPLCQSQLDADRLGSADCDEVVYDVLMDPEIEDFDTQSEDKEVSGDSTATVESQAGVPMGSHVPQTKLTFESENETNSMNAGRKRSAATVMEDDLISMIAPFVIKQIEDALKPLLSVLRSREDEQKHREKLLAIAEEKLDLKPKEMQGTHRVLANSEVLATSNQEFEFEVCSHTPRQADIKETQVGMFPPAVPRIQAYIGNASKRS